MGGGNTTTTTQESGLKNPAMDAAATTIGNQLNTALQTGVKPFTGSMVPGLSSATMAGVSGLTNNAASPIFSKAMGDTIGDFGAIASGQRMGENDAAWNAARDRVTADTNAAFNASGRFGGGANVAKLGEGLAGVELSRIMGNEARQMQAAGMLPGLYQGATMPASMALQAGQIVDANAAAKAQDEARIWDAVNNAPWNTLQRGASIFGGTAPISGTTQTNTQPGTPWWQSALGGAIGIGSLFL